MANPDYDAFGEWFVEAGYSRLTAANRVRQLRAYVRDGRLPVSGSYAYHKEIRAAYKAYQRFAAETSRAKLRLPEPVPVAPSLKDRKARRRARKERLVGIKLEEWKALRARVQADPSTRARVLEVLMSTGKRVADVLRVDRRALTRALARKDGELVITVKGDKPVRITVNEARPEWARLERALPENAKNVASGVVRSRSANPEADGPAYKAVQRKLRELAEGIVEGPVYLHRLRRSVAALMFRSGAPLESIQKVLSHDSVNTTQIYTSEAMPDVAAKALTEMRRQLGIGGDDEEEGT